MGTQDLAAVQEAQVAQEELPHPLLRSDLLPLSETKASIFRRLFSATSLLCQLPLYGVNCGACLISPMSSLPAPRHMEGI